MKLLCSALTCGLFAAALAGLLGERSTHAAEVDVQVLKAQKQRVEVIGKAARTAVCVFGPGGKGGGSGVVITPDGYALTNYHVVKPCGNYMKCSMADDRLYDAVVVSIDPGGDVALIKLLGRNDFPHAELGDSDKARVGDWCFAAGNPFLLATDFQPTISYGIISGVHRYQYPAGTLLEYADCIQTDAAINPGNSGGPLYNAKGQVIGINGRCSFEKRGRVNVGVGYAISSNQIKKFLGHLRSGRILDHATLGATVTSSDEGKVVVDDILESSDAFRRGLRYGDEIVAFGERPITTVNGFKNALGIYPKGWRIPLTYRRDGQRHEILVRLQGVHSREELLAKVQRSPRGGGDPKKPPRPMPRRRPTRTPPPKIKNMIDVRPGFSNYYFNKLERDRVWKRFTTLADFSAADANWQLDGVMAAGGAARVTIRDGAAEGRFPIGEAEVDVTGNLAEQTGPRNSGGLVAALLVWRRMLVRGPEKFGEVYYLGKAPVPGQDQLCDVLVATFEVTESRFYFEPGEGKLVALEMYPDVGVDPCEIYFGEYREVDGRQLPHRMTVRHGDDRFGVFQWKQWRMAAKSEKKDP